MNASRKTVLLLKVIVALPLAGCTTFADIRSAEVTPGVRLDSSVTASSPPGDDAAWFWTLYCAQNCNHAIVSSGVRLSKGMRYGESGRGFEIGGGIAGASSGMTFRWVATFSTSSQAYFVITAGRPTAKTRDRSQRWSRASAWKQVTDSHRGSLSLRGGRGVRTTEG